MGLAACFLLMSSESPAFWVPTFVDAGYLPLFWRFRQAGFSGKVDAIAVFSLPAR